MVLKSLPTEEAARLEIMGDLNVSLPKSTVILEFNADLFFYFSSFKRHIGFDNVVWTPLPLYLRLIAIFIRS